MFFYHSVNHLSTFFVGSVGHRACVYYHNVSLFVCFGLDETDFAELSAKGGCFGEIEFATKCLKCYFFIFEYSNICHNCAKLRFFIVLYKENSSKKP